MNKLVDIGNSQFRIQVDNISLNNFRGFGGISIFLDPQLTVFVANNGGGKTTVLDAIFEGVRSFIREVKLPVSNTDQSLLSESDVKNGNSVGNILTTLLLEYYLLETDEEDNFPDASTLYEGIIETIYSLNSVGGVKYSLNQINDDHTFRILEAQTNFRKNTDNLPIVKYFHLGSRKGTKSQNAFKWLYSWVDKRQKIAGQAGGNSIYQYHLGLVETAFSQFLSDEDYKYSNLKVSYGLEKDSLTLTKTHKSSAQADILDMDQLSSGEQALLSTVADIAISLIDATPQTPYDYDPGNYGQDDYTPLRYGTGVVLIDEIDLHLHPIWQRRVVPKLLEIFPNVQFVVTTHSPVILGGIASKHIRVLHLGRIYSVEDTYGREVDDILEIIMQVDAGEYTRQIKKIAHRIADGDIDDAEQLLSSMQNEIDEKGDNGAEHPDILLMRNLLTRKKTIGR